MIFQITEERIEVEKPYDYFYFENLGKIISLKMKNGKVEKDIF